MCVSFKLIVLNLLKNWQGLYKQEGKDRYGENYRMWQRDAANFEIDGHYPVRELWARAQSCWQSILDSDGISVLVVAHNAVNQALVATATGSLLLRKNGL
jgi:broad specificity phosphatase PhoE